MLNVKEADNYKSTFRQIDKNIGKIGWILPMDITPRRAQEIGLMKVDEAKKALFEYYSEYKKHESIIKIICGSKIASKYKVLIKQIDFAYKNEKYALALSALIPMYEGILSEIIINKKKDNLDQIIAEIEKEWTHNKTEVYLAFMQSIKEFIKKFSCSVDFTCKNYQINRHAFAHGRLEIPDSKIDVVRLICGIYNIVYFLKVIESA